jgi:hypothetical protein
MASRWPCDRGQEDAAEDAAGPSSLGTAAHRITASGSPAGGHSGSRCASRPVVGPERAVQRIVPLQQIWPQHCIPHPAASAAARRTPATPAPAAILRVHTDIGDSEELIDTVFRGCGWAWLNELSQRSQQGISCAPVEGAVRNHMITLQGLFDYQFHIIHMGTGTGCQYRLPQAMQALGGFGISRHSNVTWS